MEYQDNSATQEFVVVFDAVANAGVPDNEVALYAAAVDGEAVVVAVPNK